MKWPPYKIIPPAPGLLKNLNSDRRDRPLCLSDTLTKDNHGEWTGTGACPYTI